MQGEEQKAARRDQQTRSFIKITEWSGHLAGMASEEMDAPYQIPAPLTSAAKYLLVFDPLDGSSQTSTSNVSVGRHLLDTARGRRGRGGTAGRDPRRGPTSCSPAPRRWRPATRSMGPVDDVSCSRWGSGVVGFTLDPKPRASFKLTHPAQSRCQPTHTSFAINSSNARFLGAAGQAFMSTSVLAGKGQAPRGARLQHALDRQHGGPRRTAS